MAEPGVIIERPNRDKPASKATKAIVILLLLVSAALVAIVLWGGWSKLAGAKPMHIGYILLYLVIAFFVGRWNRGVLPVAAALAIILLIFAAVSGPQWLDRDKTGFEQPALDAALVGLITLLIIPVQVLLIAFVMRGFQQQWNVEVERPVDDYEGGGGYEPPERPRRSRPATA